MFNILDSLQYILTYLGDLKYKISNISRKGSCMHAWVCAYSPMYCCRFRPEYKMCYQGKVAGCGLNLVFLSTLGTTQSTADFLCGEGNSGKPLVEFCRTVNCTQWFSRNLFFNILR